MKTLLNIVTFLLFVAFILYAWLCVSLLGAAEINTTQHIAIALTVIGMLISGTIIMYVVRIKIKNR